MKQNNTLPDVRGAFDAIVDALEEQHRKMRTFDAIVDALEKQIRKLRKFDAIVDAMDEQIRKMRTFAADNLAKTVSVNGETDQIISVADAAEVISKSKVTVLRYCKEGALKPYKAPGAKVTTGVYLSSLNALLKS